MADIVQLKEDGVPKYLKTHAKAIDGIDGNLVKATGNETILGTKNFQDGLQVAGKNPVLTKSTADYALVDKNNSPTIIADGKAELYRRGDLVYLTGSFKLSQAKENQSIWSSMPAWAAPAGQVRTFWRSGDKFYLLTFDPAGINNVVCVEYVAKDAWLTGSNCWLAKNPY